MSNFEYYLQDIAADISSPNDADNFDDFMEVKNYVLQKMRKEDSYFDEICQNDILFGSAAHNIRLHNDDEYDVLMELRFPAHKRIIQVENKNRPGFVFLDFSEASYDDKVTYELANNQKSYLNRSLLKKWLHNIFTAAMSNYYNVVYSGFEQYELSYSWRGITYTIYAESESRSFSIDFVPAVKIERPNSKTWYAIPKEKSGPGNTANFTYMISNSQAELQHVKNCGCAMQDALRLMQALRSSRGLQKLRCYHMVTVAIWMARRLGHKTVQNMSVTQAFLSLLSDLCDAFIERHLSYVWDSGMNLLSNFNSGELSHYANELCSAFNTLKSYPYQSTLSYRRCQQHFI
ncbi:cyclic GMP-AMP synthase-like receptor [Drosophila nasuta]|uniref:cyclic GMP-AMP synthase-like receptor n=1 Tax=Drosophila nasuta TaxID=42062 RepID=UPI00295E6EBF|nr:cyclic GMP-AMP synthase-like receptor [Drosophila nasuta]